jgi:hypothetical protein
MASEKKVLNTVIKRFPESHLLIIELFHQSDFFRSICKDYAVCFEVMNRLESSEQMTKKGYKMEYKILLEELEKEIISRLTE